MTWYYYLHYRIYKFYQRKKDSMPQLFSLLAPSALVGLNILSVAFTLGFFYPDFGIFFNKHVCVAIFLILVLINYLVLYRGKYYEEIFADFDKYQDRYNSWKNSVPIYIISSIVLLLVVLAIADYRHDGHF